MHAYIKMLQLPDLPLDEETTSFTVIPREKSSYLQNININVSNGQLQFHVYMVKSHEMDSLLGPVRNSGGRIII